MSTKKNPKRGDAGISSFKIMTLFPRIFIRTLHQWTHKEFEPRGRIASTIRLILSYDAQIKLSIPVMSWILPYKMFCRVLTCVMNCSESWSKAITLEANIFTFYTGVGFSQVRLISLWPAYSYFWTRTPIRFRQLSIHRTSSSERFPLL